VTRARTKASAAVTTANTNALVSTTTLDVSNGAAMLASCEFIDRIAAEVFRGVVVAVRGALAVEERTSDSSPAPAESGTDVMTADEVAAFLGVDRNTVYDFAGRGVIPHQRLGKRLLFRRGALVSWLDSSLCKATSTRKAG
jgi:excisionase family DNA binding protein